MKIKWLGHSSFLVTTEEGVKIITDPYHVDGAIAYAPINESADVITVSHSHGDHNNELAVKGNPRVIKSAGIIKVKGIEFKGISSHHDDSKGSQRGNNIIFCFNIDGINICHLGDLGHLLSDKEIAEIGPVDILMIPVGGTFTIDASQATSVSQSLKARIIMPMHCKTSKCNLPISGVDEFLKDKKNVRKLDSSEIEFKKGVLPREAEIVVPRHAL